jgi:hypothetical protein
MINLEEIEVIIGENGRSRFMYAASLEEPALIRQLD